MAPGEVELAIVGISQDGGVPQAGCECESCSSAILDPKLRLHPVCCAIRGSDGSLHIIEATRNLPEQLGIAASVLGLGGSSIPDTVCLTHAHLGHIDGLGQFGKESMGLSEIPLFASKSVVQFLDSRGFLNPFQAKEVQAGTPFHPSEGCGFQYTMIPVPHRDEFSDTHAIVVEGPNSKLLFLPDHDDWGKTLESSGFEDIRGWLLSLDIDFALVDGTFWDNSELRGRDMSQIPHPTISETLERIGNRGEEDPDIIFIHINHTNPVLDKQSAQYGEVASKGWSVAKQGSSIVL
tara:strand:+ start:5081 stop:5959 length:879 start_codon:yes stop_codon:yes gene_type:complete